MKKIILSTLICLSINLSAQVIPIDMSKIKEISEEEKQKKYFKELFEDFKLTHNENAPLITEEQCFKQAYEELKRTPITPDTNNLNSPFKGYDKQVIGLTKFTNTKGRGMSCKDTTIFYIIEAVDAVKKVNSSNIKREEKIEKIISAAKTANEIAEEKFRAEKEEKEFNSNPKNFSYKENWEDYENGVYKLKFEEVLGEERNEIIKNNKIKLHECKINDKVFFVPFHIFRYNKEELIGLLVSAIDGKLKKVKVDFGDSIIANSLEKESEEKYGISSFQSLRYQDKNLYYDNTYSINFGLFYNLSMKNFQDLNFRFTFKLDSRIYVENNNILVDYEKYPISLSFDMSGSTEESQTNYIFLKSHSCIFKHN